MNNENGHGCGASWPGGLAVTELLHNVEVWVDRAALVALCGALGETFEERFEDAVFEVSERLSRIEALARRRDFEAAACEAEAAVACLLRIGLAGAASIAVSLSEVCRAGDATAASAICARLMRVGEEGLIRAAELSVELIGCAEGA